MVAPIMQAQEGQAPGLGQAAGDAEVEQRGAAVGQHEEVAAVQVAVEDAVEHARPPGSRSSPVRTTASVSMPAAFMPATSSKREPVEPLHHEHRGG